MGNEWHYFEGENLSLSDRLTARQAMTGDRVTLRMATIIVKRIENRIQIRGPRSYLEVQLPG